MSGDIAFKGSWIIDLDGVVWLAGEAIDGVREAVATLRDQGVRVVFATNNSAPTIAELLARMERAGIPAEAADLITSAQAAASLVGEGDAVLALAEGGAREALLARGARLVEDGPVDAVVGGWTYDFTSTGWPRRRPRPRRPADRHQRGRHPPDTRWPAARRRRSAGGGGDGGRRRARGRRQAAPPHDRTHPGPTPGRQRRGGRPPVHRWRAGPGLGRPHALVLSG